MIIFSVLKMANWKEQRHQMQLLKLLTYIKNTIILPQKATYHFDILR